VEMKANAREKSLLPDELDRAHRAAWPALESRLDRALEASPLPAEPENLEEIDRWLVARRLDALPT